MFEEGDKECITSKDCEENNHFHSKSCLLQICSDLYVVKFFLCVSVDAQVSTVAAFYV